MGERLCAMLPSEENLRLLAESYLRAGRPSQAKAVLEDCSEPQSRYLYGVVCIDLNLVREAEAALRPVGLRDYALESEMRGEPRTTARTVLPSTDESGTRKPHRDPTVWLQPGP